jgi:preprotein translocase subunit SecG
MLTIILIIGIIAAVLTVLIVLIQNPKGGGLASNFSAGNQLFGAKQTTEGVEKLTWIFVTVILLVSLVASSYNGGKKTGKAGETTTTAAPASDPTVNDAINAKAPKGSNTTPAPANQDPNQNQNQQNPAPPQQVPLPPKDPNSR